MKLIKFILPLLIIANLAVNAQSLIVKGFVSDKHGSPLHLAFIQDKQYKNGAYTDSLGNFTLTVTSNSMLNITCTGYKDTLVNVNGRASITIALQTAVIIAAKKTANDAENGTGAVLRTTIRDQINLEPQAPAIIRQGSIMPVIHSVDATQGSRFLFKDWERGYVINDKDSLVQSAAYLLNYDKIGGKLLFTLDKATLIAIDDDKLKSFTLFDALNQPHTFVLVPEIDKSLYVEVIASGGSYKIYKLTRTEFVKANYRSDGVASTGNNYDEYVDTYTYYVIGKTGVPKKFALRKKSLKDAFSDDPNKINQYFSTNNGDINDDYLKGLGDYMNK
jgi:hypothetical protein